MLARVLFMLLAIATAVFVVQAWTDGGGGRSDAAALIFAFLCGAPLWLPFLCVLGEDCSAAIPT